MTGEILRANVRLGSQRVHQVMQIAEVVLAPYGKPDEAQLLDQATEFVKARVRRLAAHEIGHAIGFMHNYASTNHPVASVMDYPHPRIRMRADGQGVDISDPYPEGLGDWDYFTVRHAYAQFDPADETAQLSRLRQQAAAAGLTYVTDADGAATTASNPDGVQWVMGGDAFEGLRDILRVRRHVLEHFGPGVLAPDRDAGELGERLTTAYLLHRHELTGVARYLGGVRYESGWAGDTGIGTSAVAGPTQYQALAALADLLSADHLRVPRRAVQCVNPVGARYATIPEYLTSEFGPVFDPLRAAEVAASLVIASAVEPARLNRLAWQHAQDPSIPSVAEVASQTIVAAFPRPNDESDALLAATAGATVLDQVLATLLRSELHSVVAGDLTEALHSIAESWADESFGARVRASARIRAFLDDPARVNLRQAPPIPPGAPI
jgi:hypothetical protein